MTEDGAEASRPGSSELGVEFARLHMEGADFHDARIPVESLIEIQRYQDAVLDAAIFAWQRDHPGEDVPADFADGMKLILSDVKDGSATPVLERPYATEYDEYYDEGRDELDQTVEELELWLAAVPESRPAPDPMQYRMLSSPAFRELGANMPDDATLGILRPQETEGVQISKVLREEAILPLAEERTRLLKPVKEERVTVPGEIAGQLISLNADKRSFEMISSRFGGVHGRYRTDSLTDDLRQVLDHREYAPLVRFTAELRYQGAELKQLLNVTAVQLLETDGKPWSRRFKELASLDAGWEEESGLGEPVAFAALDAARELLNSCVEAEREIPGIFPMVDGGVQLEWASPRQVTSIEISPDIEFTLFDLVTESNSVEELATTDIKEAMSFVTRTNL